jgi:hypothetical protein
MVAIAAPDADAASSPGEAKLAYRVAAVHVDGGEATWHSDDQFHVRWDLAGGGSEVQPTEFAYRIDDERGQPVGPVKTVRLAEDSTWMSIPHAPGEMPAPGVYRLLVWMQNATQAGPAATATLRQDTSPPAPVRPTVPTEWLLAGSMAEVGIEHPGWPRPLSGIRGYAVEVDQGTGSEPCGGRAICTLAETALPGGEDDDTILLGPFTEAANVVRVVAVSGTGARSTQAESAALRIDGTPPTVRLRGASAGWSNHPLEIEATASDGLSGVLAAGPAGPSTAIAVDGEPPTVTPGDRATATVHGDGVHQVTAFARDAVGNTGASDPGAAQLVARIDETAPRVAFASAQDPGRPERIVARVEDQLSGPSSERGSIQVRPAGSGLPFEALETVVAGARLLADWDSDAVAQGSYEFRAVGFDAAGNRTESSRRADGAAMLLSNPVKLPTTLAVGFGGRSFLAHRCRRDATGLHCDSHAISSFARRPASTRVAYGRGVPVAGRLATATGAPLGDRRVTITETFDAGTSLVRRETTVSTGPDGVFLAHLGRGPSREIAIAFAGDEKLTRSVGRELRLGVRTALRLRTSTSAARVGGPPVVFTGHLGRRAAEVPLGGVAVQLEFRVAGLPWGEFRTVRSDRRGRFRYPYAFSDDDSRGVRFQFRAHVASQAGWPYAEAYSRPIAVTGR